MGEKLNTVVQSPKGKKELFHHFILALALGVALEEGLPLKREDFEKIKTKLKKSFKENNYVKWNKEYPFDHDDTIMVRNIFDLIEKPTKKELKLDFSKEGGVYTYVGGLKSKSNNSIDMLINLIILDYLIRNKIKKAEKERIIKFLKKRKKYFKKNVENISKYYLSEGYLIYLLSKVHKSLGINIEELIKLKTRKIKNKTDIGFLILASSKINNELIRKFKRAEKKPLQLFQHPRLKLTFSCSFLDEVVRKCVENKIRGIDFNKVISRTYNRIGEKLYNYSKSSRDLIELLKKYSLEDEQLVELGVGTANFSTYLLRKRYRVLGIDISKEMLDIAKRKTKNFSKVKYILQNIKELNIGPTKVIYSHNFIDFKDGMIEIWATDFEDSSKILKSISDNLLEGGFLFVNKKQDKGKSKEFKLFNKKIIENHKLTNIYVYQDKKFVMRKKYTKVIINKQDFKEIMQRLRLEIIDETGQWIVLLKRAGRF